MFELNPATLPAIGTPFTDDLSFFQRLQNTVFILGTKIMFGIFQGIQAQTFKKYGYSFDEDSGVVVSDAMMLIQYPPGFCFSISKPPNMVFLNYITPKAAKELEDKNISNFLNKYEKNIYLSQGTIMKNINFAEITEIFEHFRKQKIGFVLSIKKEIAEKHVFPSNVFLTNWVNQNDLLGDKRVKLFITHAGINSVLEAIYHQKPVIALGVSLDQVNTAGLVKARETGIVFTSISQLTPQNLIPAIEKTLEENNFYLKNTKKFSKILKNNEKATEVFTYWMQYGFEIGYEHLLVKAYTSQSFIALNNLDVVFTLLIFGLLVLYLIKKLFACFLCFGINTNSDKVKQE
jgi:glucuronosyltransferase